LLEQIEEDAEKEKLALEKKLAARAVLRAKKLQETKDRLEKRSKQ
jgi:hypothetical protein